MIKTFLSIPILLLCISGFVKKMWGEYYIHPTLKFGGNSEHDPVLQGLRGFKKA